jgi:hypothetical protein
VGGSGGGWNVFQPPPELAAGLAGAYRRVVPSLPAFDLTDVLAGYAPMFTAAAGGIGRAGAFAEPQEWRFAWERTYTRREWLDQVPTQGGAGQLPAARLAELTEAIGAAVDEVGGSFAMRYTTVVVTAVRR